MASMTSGGRQAQWSIVKFTDTYSNGRKVVITAIRLVAVVSYEATITL